LNPIIYHNLGVAVLQLSLQERRLQVRQVLGLHKNIVTISIKASNTGQSGQKNDRE